MANLTEKLRGLLVGSKGMTNHHTTWGGKSRLVGENPDNSCRWEDDDPDEENVPLNARKYVLCSNSSMVPHTFFFTTRPPRVAAGSTSHCAPECVVIARWCTRKFFDSGA
ncbi:hypothetical protein TNCV_3722491 [Trichonephila clavipes]|nr:hypothetical protein TNCV_3722491 [Trichonephila clavipes]